MSDLIKFFPSYVGSKAHWVDKLNFYQGRRFVELFCGSSVLSANLAGSCILNDLDFFVAKILNEFDKQIVPASFTQDDYFRVRKQPDWWKYTFCLQKMSFSGVFRYSKNGYNVPIKKDILEVNLEDLYKKALSRWMTLKPKVFNQQYFSLNNLIEKSDVLVLDPPYENALASYNTTFDYQKYWEFVRLNENICRDILLFDFVENLPFPPFMSRKTRVNGARSGNFEGVFCFKDSLHSGFLGEKVFAFCLKDKLRQTSGIQNDFQLKKTNHFVELKSEYYSLEKTPNFFIERYSDRDKKTPGGPWQAATKGVRVYIHFFVKNGVYYVFDSQKLINFLESKEFLDNHQLVPIPNKTWITEGYKVNRKLLANLFFEQRIDDYPSKLIEFFQTYGPKKTPTT